MNTRFPDNPICPMSSPKGQSGIGGPDVEWLAASLILPSECDYHGQGTKSLASPPRNHPVNMITAEEGKEDWREPF